jgi:membrane-bound lytic murein transglycosylase B
MKGSYAGAIGKPQFMASSYRNFAVDFDNDSKKDLIKSDADIIGSIANFFRQHHWRSGADITVKAAISGSKYSTLLGLGVKPKMTIRQLRALGVTPVRGMPDNTAAVLLKLKAKSGYFYRLGLHNFYVITRYNRSVNYAMAVYELSKRLQKAFKGAS